MPMHIGQATLDSVVVIGQPGVVDAKQMQCGRMQIVAIGWRFHGFESEFIGRSVAHAAANSSTGEPCGEPARVVVASFAFGPLSPWLPTKFRRADHQCVIEHSLLF